MERFWSRVEKTSECWLWQGQQRGGYGTFWHNNVRTGAHRFSWSLVNGDIPKGMVIMHSCDEPMCVNPDHLTPGTQSQNIQDMYQKNRGGGKGRFSGVTECVRGHPFNEENTYYRPSGGRACRACKRLR